MSSQRYWAFLSYSSKDAGFVKKLHTKLETYRMPRDLVGRPGLDEPIPKKLFPVFRDRDELPLASDLGSTIQDALHASRYLIVICSPNSARSQWVNEEIRCFKAIGRANRILALIIDGEPNASRDPNSPVEECFPQALRFHVDADGTITDQPTEPIAGDLRPGKDGWDMAFLKCIAGITGCGLNALTAREKKRARRRKLLMAAAGLVLAAGATGWWDYTRIKIHHYAEIAERFGVPEGYHELSSDQVAHRELSYKVESSRRKVRSITCVHSSGVPTEQGEFDSAIQELKFGEDDSLQEIVYRNPMGHITARRIFSALKDQTRIIEFKSEHDDSPLALSAKDISMSSSASMAARTEVTAQRATYADDGSLKEVRFLSLWREPRADPDGVFGMRYEYDGGLLHSKIINLDAEGQAVKNRRGFAVAKFRRNAMGLIEEVGLFDEQQNPVMEPELYHCYRYQYDRYGNRIIKTFYDESMQPIEASLGYHQMALTRSDAGDILTTKYYDRSLKPVMSMDGYHEVRETYDARGETLSTQYFDQNGKPAVDKWLVHEMRMTRDQHGYEISREYYDINRAPFLGGERRIFREAFTYHTNGMLQSLSYFDVELKPMVPLDFVAHRTEFQIDSLGRLKSWANYDVKGQPIRGAEGESMVRVKHDHRGNVIEMANFDATGTAFDVNGFHRISNEFNDRGLIVKSSNWAANGQPANNFKGIHLTVTEYDDRGHKSGESYFAANQKATVDLIGVHRYQYRRDDRGNVLEERYFDVANRPKPASNGVYIFRFQYTDAGKPKLTQYFDKDDKPMLSNHGIHSFTATYDSRGNNLETASFGIDGKAVRHREENVHCIVYEYDERNRDVVVRYLDEQRLPMAGHEGWHERRYEKDLRGNITLTQYFSPDRKPMNSDDGVHLLRARYDEKDRLLEKSCFGPDEKPVLCDAGWHRLTIDRFDQDNTDESRYFGVDGKPIIHPTKGWHKEKVSYPKNGAIKEVSFYDVNEQPGTDAEGIHRYVYEISHGNETACSYFDKKGQPYYVGNYCRWEKSFNGLGQMTELRWYDEGREPASNPSGVYRQSKRILDSRTTEFANFNGDGNPMKDKEGVHRWRQTTDDQDRIVEIMYLDPNGDPLKEANGVHRVKNRYDARGNIIRKEFLLANGKPALVPAGHAGYEAEFDELNREISHTWMGEDGKPVALHDHVARWTSRYDENGKEIERRFFGADLQRTLGSGGHHMRRSQFDAAGNETERSFFGINDEPVGIEYGLHRWAARYHANGRLLEKSFFDIAQQALSHPEGNHRFLHTFDDRGNQIRTEYFGTTGEPVLWEKQYHRIERGFDQKDNETSIRYFGTKGEAVENDDGYHVMESLFDDLGRPTEVTVSDREGKQPSKIAFRKMKMSYYLNLPLVAKKSYYDSDGKLLHEQKLDMRGNPID